MEGVWREREKKEEWRKRKELEGKGKQKYLLVILSPKLRLLGGFWVQSTLILYSPDKLAHLLSEYLLNPCHIPGPFPAAPTKGHSSTSVTDKPPNAIRMRSSLKRVAEMTRDSTTQDRPLPQPWQDRAGRIPREESCCLSSERPRWVSEVRERRGRGAYRRALRNKVEKRAPIKKHGHPFTEQPFSRALI